MKRVWVDIDHSHLMCLHAVGKFENAYSNIMFAMIKQLSIGNGKFFFPKILIE